MANGRAYDRPAVYQIRVKGCLEQQWSDWFDGFDITQPAKDETLLFGPVTDQAALYGVLLKMLNLGLPLISVVRLEDKGASLHGQEGSSEDGG
jgi:hypothetical protein